MHVNFENFELKIGTEVIERIGNNCKTKYFKFVGIHLDEHISWQYQINHVHAKLASANYAISSSKHFLPRKIRLTLYNSLFRSHLEFGLLAWWGLSSNKLLKIINTQKKCVRNVAGKGHRSHTGPIFSSLGLLKFNDMFEYQCSIFMHKYLHNKLPSSFDNKFTKCCDYHIGWKIDKSGVTVLVVTEIYSRISGIVHSLPLNILFTLSRLVEIISIICDSFKILQNANGRLPDDLSKLVMHILFIFQACFCLIPDHKWIFQRRVCQL